MRSLPRVPASLVVALLVLGCSGEPDAGLTPGHAAAIEDSVTRALESFRRYSESAEWDSLAGLYSTDPGFRFAESGAVQYGSAEEVRAALAGIPSGTTISTSLEDPHIHPVAPGVAVLTAPFRTAFVDSSGGGFDFGGVLTLVWVHEPGGWRIRAGHSSAPVPRGP